MSSLSPCPFCGKDDSTDNATQDAGVVLSQFKSAIGKTAYRVECACGAFGAPDLDPLIAIHSWNSRTPGEGK